jgi:hypothetical protein
MGKLRDLPLGTYPNGTRAFGPYAFAGGTDNLGFSVGRATAENPTIWASELTTLTFDVQFSFDSGVTYTDPGTWVWTQKGGMLIDSRTGLAVSELRVAWHFAPDPLTHIKGRITVAGGPIYTYLDIDGV